MTDGVNIMKIVRLIVNSVLMSNFDPMLLATTLEGHETELSVPRFASLYTV
jgi:hypothetical protein